MNESRFFWFDLGIDRYIDGSVGKWIRGTHAPCVASLPSTSARVLSGMDGACRGGVGVVRVSEGQGGNSTPMMMMIARAR